MFAPSQLSRSRVRERKIHHFFLSAFALAASSLAENVRQKIILRHKMYFFFYFLHIKLLLLLLNGPCAPTYPFYGNGWPGQLALSSPYANPLARTVPHQELSACLDAYIRGRHDLFCLPKGLPRTPVRHAIFYRTASHLFIHPTQEG